MVWKFFIFATIVLLMPVMAHAAPVEFPLVQCGGFDASGAEQAPCEPCDLYEAFGRVINLVLFGITAPIAAFMIVLAGGMMLLGGANPDSFSKGKKMLADTLWGVTVILLAWVLTNFLVKSLGGASGDATPWYEFECPQFLVNAPRPGLPAPAPSRGSAQSPAPELTEANTKLCTDKVALATSYKANPAQPGTNAPSLQKLMECIQKDPVVNALRDPNNQHTFEKNNPLCNLTHGLRVCGRCQHVIGSCHYGGKTGTQGALAVDYNVQTRGGSVIYVKLSRQIVSAIPKEADPTLYNSAARNEQSLLEEIQRSMKINNCEYKNVGIHADGGGGHTHVTARECDSN